MRAFVCDACGKMYRPYFKLDRFGEGNAMTVVKIEKDGQMRGKLRLELCPTCMADVWDYLQTGLVQEEGPAYKRVNREASTLKEAIDESEETEVEGGVPYSDYQTS